MSKARSICLMPPQCGVDELVTELAEALEAKIAAGVEVELSPDQLRSSPLNPMVAVRIPRSIDRHIEHYAHGHIGWKEFDDMWAAGTVEWVFAPYIARLTRQVKLRDLGSRVGWWVRQEARRGEMWAQVMVADILLERSAG